MVHITSNEYVIFIVFITRNPYNNSIRTVEISEIVYANTARESEYEEQLLWNKNVWQKI